MTTPIAQGPVDVNVRGWRSVDDYLPNKGDVVLTYSTIDRMTIRKFCSGKFAESTDRVTHWMTLPESPNDFRHDSRRSNETIYLEADRAPGRLPG